MTDAPPPPIPNPPVRPGALPDPRRWLDLDFKAIEERVITVCGIDPAALGHDRTAVMAALYGRNTPIVIIDESHLVGDVFDRKWSDKRDGLLDDEFLTALKGLKDVKPAQPAEFKPDNRKQRRINYAKARRKPRGQRKKLIMDIESYDPNRTKDWLR